MYVVNPMPTPIPEEYRQALLETDTGTIGHFLYSGFMDPGIEQKRPGSKIAGTAITVRVTLPDSVIAHYALKNIRPGDILIIDRGGDKAVSCWGGTTSLGAVKMGLNGLIMDGACNDISQANEYGLPIWCRGVTPITTKYLGIAGELNVPISCGGMPVSPGDAVLADENGVLVITPGRLQSVIAEAQEYQKMEQDGIEQIRKADTINYPDLSGATKIVEEALKKQGG